ncbi:hypothetical protein ACFP1Z_32790 [Streptomyces gamaensis]|uniref:DUF222 domain-containing protein n=1 Tax=Streptomyces gamaensis TaxID=1763542 RepID=A0ABW0ZAD6_9ACTN
MEVPPPPEEYRERIAAITAALAPPHDPRRLTAADTDAAQLDREFTARYGDTHTHTVQIRELRGWTAHLKGEPATAARWYLHTTGLQARIWGAHHALTKASAHRAVQHWNGITDPADRLTVGAELLPMLTAVTGQDSTAYRTVHTAVDTGRTS